LEHLGRLWAALDHRFERVQPHRWGAVVTDARFPDVWDVNYARVERMQPGLTLSEIERSLDPALARVGAKHRHLVLFDPDEMSEILVAGSSRGAVVTWDSVMTVAASAVRPPPPEPWVQEVDPDAAFLDLVRGSLAEFDVDDERVAEQLMAIETTVLLPAGKRWFRIVADERVAALGSLLRLGEEALVDHIVTFAFARRRGYAEAIVRAIARAAEAGGASTLVLLTDPGGAAERLYQRIGFRRARRIASLRERSDTG
jgi:ribosomal protein S18 acetylase RimI-like enzyme